MHICYIRGSVIISKVCKDIVMSAVIIGIICAYRQYSMYTVCIDG